MLSGQCSVCKSLRVLVFSFNRQARKFYHLGLTTVKRSALVDADEKRPAVVFEQTCRRL
jgi:hypothetical protein